MKYPILYKKNTNGSIQQWQMEIQDNKFRTISGKLNGKLVTSEWTTCEGKNIGRSNETSPNQQAIKEVESEYKKKKEQKGYLEDLSNAEENDRKFSPMLADKYKDRIDYATEAMKSGNLYSQPKFDGIRCTINKNGMWTRNGKPITSSPHIFKEFKNDFEVYPDLILDGELYNHEFKDNFNEIVSLVKKQKSKQSDFDETKKLVRFYCYDYVSKDKFSDRMKTLKKKLLNKNYTIVVETFLIKDQSHMDELESEYLEEGYEGQMLRIDGFGYETKRTKNLLKRKQFQDDEFKILDIVEGIGNRSGMAGYIRYKMKDGKTFESGIRGNFDYYKEIFKNKKKYIGGIGTVRYFNLTPDGVPRFPVTIVIYKKGENRD